VTINLEQSSQYLSGLLLAAPLASGTTTIRLIGTSVASWPYVALTLDTMARFGVPVILERRILDDWQPCTHAEAAGISPHGHPPHRPSRSLPGRGHARGRRLVQCLLLSGRRGRGQGSGAHFRAEQAIGPGRPLHARNPVPHGRAVEWQDDAVTVFPSALRGTQVDMNACPDIVPTVAAMAAFATGETVIFGAAHLALKECDRIQGPVTELSKAGVNIEARPDGMVIRGNGGLLPRSVDLCTYGDHRMAMSFSLLELAGITVNTRQPLLRGQILSGILGCLGQNPPRQRPGSHA
jgi:3-phosphoshikimate 1-carboxyvinyltransferase